MASNDSTAVNEYQSSLLTAVDYLVTKKLDSLTVDRTITAVVNRCVNAATGQYELTYQGGKIKALAQSTSITWSKGDAVYVLVPESDFTNTLVIIGGAAISSSDSNTGYVTSAINGYSETGGNLIVGGSKPLCVNSYLAEDVSLGYTAGNIIDDKFKLEGDYSSNSSYLNQTIQSCEKLLVQADFMTRLPTKHKTPSSNGHYTLVACLRFVTTNTKNASAEDKEYYYQEIELDSSSSNFTGQPLNYSTGYSTQFGIFELEDKENFDGLEYLILRSEGFESPSDLAEDQDNIFAKNIKICGLVAISAVNGDYTLDVSPLTDYFYKDENSKVIPSSVSAKATLRKNNLKVDDTSALSYCWGKRDSSVTNATCEGYDISMGAGWKKIEEANSSSFSTPSSDNESWLNEYICGVSYTPSGSDSVTLKQIFTVYNYGFNKNVSVTCQQGESFLFSQGSTLFTCDVKEESGNAPENLKDYIYKWSVAKDGNTSYVSILSSDGTTGVSAASDEETIEDTKTYFQPSDRVAAQRKEQEVSGAEIVQDENGYLNGLRYNMKTLSSCEIVTFVCEVYLGSTLMGSGSISLVNQTDSSITATSHYIEITNGSQAFQYSEAGYSPCNEGIYGDKAQQIKPLACVFKDPKGNEMQKVDYTISWDVPSGDDSFFKTSEINDDELAFTIQDLWSYSLTQRQITAHVVYNGRDYYQKTDFLFNKIGDNGTNGTELVVSLQVSSTEVEKKANYLPYITESLSRNLTLTVYKNGEVAKPEAAEDGGTTTQGDYKQESISVLKETRKSKEKIALEDNTVSLNNANCYSYICVNDSDYLTKAGGDKFTVSSNKFLDSGSQIIQAEISFDADNGSNTSYGSVGVVVQGDPSNFVTDEESQPLKAFTEKIEDNTASYVLNSQIFAGINGYFTVKEGTGTNKYSIGLTGDTKEKKEDGKETTTVGGLSHYCGSSTTRTNKVAIGKEWWQTWVAQYARDYLDGLFTSSDPTDSSNNESKSKAIKDKVYCEYYSQKCADKKSYPEPYKFILALEEALEPLREKGKFFTHITGNAYGSYVYSYEDVYLYKNENKVKTTNGSTELKVDAGSIYSISDEDEDDKFVTAGFYYIDEGSTFSGENSLSQYTDFTVSFVYQKNSTTNKDEIVSVSISPIDQEDKALYVYVVEKDTSKAGWYKQDSKGKTYYTRSEVKATFSEKSSFSCRFTDSTSAMEVIMEQFGAYQMDIFKNVLSNDAVHLGSAIDGTNLITCGDFKFLRSTTKEWCNGILKKIEEDISENLKNISGETKTTSTSYPLYFNKEYTLQEIQYNSEGKFPQYNTDIGIQIDGVGGTGIDPLLDDNCVYYLKASPIGKYLSLVDENNENTETKESVTKVVTSFPVTFKVKPDESFDGGNPENGVRVELIKIPWTTAKDGSIEQGKSQSLVVAWVPIYMYLNRYGLASLNSWNGTSITINNEPENGDDCYIMAPQIGAGKKEDDNSFTGIVMGTAKSFSKQEGSKTGLLGYSRGKQSVFINAEDGSASFGVYEEDEEDENYEGRILLSPNGESKIANFTLARNTLYGIFDKYGNTKPKAKVADTRNRNYSYDSDHKRGSAPVGKNVVRIEDEDYGIVVSSNPAFLSVKGKSLYMSQSYKDTIGNLTDKQAENKSDKENGVFWKSSGNTIADGDSFEVEIDPSKLSLFTVYKHSQDKAGSYKRTPVVGINGDGQFYTNSVQNNSASMTVNTIGAFGQQKKDGSFLGLECKYQGSNSQTGIVKQFIYNPEESSLTESNSPTLYGRNVRDKTTYFTTGVNTGDDYTNKMSLHGEDIYLMARPDADSSGNWNNALSERRLLLTGDGIAELCVDSLGKNEGKGASMSLLRLNGATQTQAAGDGNWSESLSTSQYGQVRLESLYRKDSKSFYKTTLQMDATATPKITLTAGSVSGENIKTATPTGAMLTLDTESIIGTATKVDFTATGSIVLKEGAESLSTSVTLDKGLVVETKSDNNNKQSIELKTNNCSLILNDSASNWGFVDAGGTNKTFYQTQYGIHVATPAGKAALWLDGDNGANACLQITRDDNNSHFISLANANVEGCLVDINGKLKVNDGDYFKASGNQVTMPFLAESKTLTFSLKGGSAGSIGSHTHSITVGSFSSGGGSTSTAIYGLTKDGLSEIVSSIDGNSTFSDLKKYLKSLFSLEASKVYWTEIKAEAKSADLELTGSSSGSINVAYE
jgi:hypothetical protein